MFFSKSRNCVQPVVERIKVIYKMSGSLRGRRWKGKGKGIWARDHVPRVSLELKNSLSQNSLSLPFPFKRLPRRLNECVIKLFGSIQKIVNLSVLIPVFGSCIIHTLFVEIPRYLEIPLIDFCETSHNRRQTPKVSVA